MTKRLLTLTPKIRLFLLYGQATLPVFEISKQVLIMEGTRILLQIGQLCNFHYNG